jgi:ABC-type microcin C transport system duplicated ATPase subunit YejF
MTALLEVEDLRKNFGGGASLLGAKRATTRAVDGVFFTLAAGETLGLVGETGSGKSTLGRLVLRLIEPSGGRLRFEGQDVLRASASELRAMRPRMQMVFQDPYGSLDPRMTAGQIIAEPMKTQGMSRAEARERVGALLSLVGLRAAMAGRYPHALVLRAPLRLIPRWWCWMNLSRHSMYPCRRKSSIFWRKSRRAHRFHTCSSRMILPWCGM